MVTGRFNLKPLAGCQPAALSFINVTETRKPQVKKKKKQEKEKKKRALQL